MEVDGAADHGSEECGGEGEMLLAHILRGSTGKSTAVDATHHRPPASDCGDSSGGYTVKKRARWRALPWREESMLDFMFENPLDGKFKDTPAVQELLRNHPGVVRQLNTSYCHYGYSYRKRTVLIGTLTQLSLKPPCPEEPCAQVSLHGKHIQEVAECGNAQKNSLPPLLIDAIVHGWLARHKGRVERFLLIDVFSGWGSIENRVLEQQAKGRWRNVFTFANDIVKRAHTQANVDMSAGTSWNPGTLLVFALNALWPEHATHVSEHPRGALGWVQENRIAVLFHCSTPCQTYSTNALATHREAGTAEPKTLQAKHDDEMNKLLIEYFALHVLTPPTAA